MYRISPFSYVHIIYVVPSEVPSLFSCLNSLPFMTNKKYRKPLHQQFPASFRVGLF